MAHDCTCVFWIKLLSALLLPTLASCHGAAFA
jgi:hypothetical protein